MDIRRVAYHLLCLGIIGTSVVTQCVAQEQAPPAEFVPPVQAEDVGSSNPAFDTVPPSLISWIREGTREADYVTGLLRYAQDYDPDGDGLDKDDIDLHMQVAIARVRAENLSRLMSNDLDGDGFVTGDEAVRSAAIWLAHTRQRADYKSLELMQAYTWVLRFDDDGDRRVTAAEFLKRTRHSVQPTDFRRYQGLLDLDPTPDGHLTDADIQTIGSRTFRAVDADVDGVISRDEYRNSKLPRKMVELDEWIGPCRMTPPRNEDLFVHLYVYAAAWQPDVTIAGQYGETRLARITIEPGDRPIYLVLSSYNPTIWQFDGAVERLAHVTVSPGYLVRAGEDVPGAGTIGIALDHVEFLRPGWCLVSHKSSSGDEDAVDRAFVRGAGRKPDVSIAPIGMEFTVPSGTMTKARSYKPSRTYEWEPGGRLHESEDRYSDPDDAVSIDPANVLAPGPVERYVVLPNYFGLRQLVAEGKLERTENGYKIIQPITHFPADTDARFILPEGITLPTGEWMYPVIVEQRYVE